LVHRALPTRQEVFIVKVIGAGFGRTGTMSLKVALEELGVGPCLHSMESLHGAQTPEAPSLWEQVIAGQPIDWRGAFAGWGSTVDWLGARFYPEMLRAWPEAKVILSVRDPEAWYESCHASLHATSRLQGAGAGAACSPVLKAVDTAIWQDIFDGRFAERDYALKVFERHRVQVAGRVPPERLLIYDIRDGWEPLCEFLGVPVPKTPFPHLNGRDAFWTRFGVKPATAAGVDVASMASAARRRRGEPARGAAPWRAPLHSHIAGLASAEAGAATLDQQQMLELLGLSEDPFAQRIFASCGVQTRHIHLGPEALAKPLQGRTAEVEEYLLTAAAEAVRKLDVDLDRIGTVISASLYSLGCPPLAHRLIEHFELDPAVDKYHLVGVGCSSAVPLVRLAQRVLPEHPDKLCLVVGAESMSGMLMGARESDSRSKTVGSAIFGDGCAAMLVGAHAPGKRSAAGPMIVASSVHQIPDSLGAVCMSLDVNDSYLHLIRELPDVAAAHLGGLVERFLLSAGMTGHMIDHWMLHPGGRRIIDCARDALNLSYGSVEISYRLLAEHGNVGTPSIFYVIDRTIAERAPRPGEHGLVITIGPGVSVGLMLLSW
jgi:predicted naringenin-chalcone synthase